MDSFYRMLMALFESVLKINFINFQGYTMNLLKVVIFTNCFLLIGLALAKAFRWDGVDH